MVKIGDLGIGLKLEPGSIEQITRELQQRMKEGSDQAGEKLGKSLSKGLDQKQATNELAKDIEQKVGKAWEKAGNKLQQSLWGGLKALVGLGVTKALSTAAGRAYTLAGNLQQADVAFTTMLGGAEASRRMLKDLSDFAANTPFELTGVRQTAKQLLAYGIEAHKIIPTLKSLGDVSAGLSVPIEQVAFAYGQVRSAGRLLGQDLRQFLNAGVPIIGELAKNLGVAESQIKDMVSAGKIGFADVEKAFQTMSSAGGKFADLMEKQSNTMMGAWSNLKDSVDSLGEAIGSLFTGEAGGLFKWMAEVVGAIKEWAVAHPALTKAIVAFVGVAGGLIGVLTTLKGLAAVVWVAFWVAALPILAVVWALWGAIAIGTFAIEKSKQHEKVVKNLGKSFADLQKEIDKNKEAIEELNKEYEEWKITTEEYEKKIKNLKNENEELKEAQDQTTMSLEDIKRAIKDVEEADLDNAEKLKRLQEINERAFATKQTIKELKAELASLDKKIQQELGYQESVQLWAVAPSSNMPREESSESLIKKRIEGLKKERQIYIERIKQSSEFKEQEEELASKIEDTNKALEEQNKLLDDNSSGWSWTSKKVDKLKDSMDGLKKSLKSAEDADKKYRDSATKTAEEVRKYYEKLGDEIRGLKKKYQDLIESFQQEEKKDKEGFLRTQIEKAKELKDAISKGKSAMIDLKQEAKNDDNQKLDYGQIDELFAIEDLATANSKLLDIQRKLEIATTEYDRERLKAQEEILSKIAEQLQLQSDLQTVEWSIAQHWKKNTEAQEEAKKKLEDYKTMMQNLRAQIDANGGKDQGIDFLFDISERQEAEKMLQYAKDQLNSQLSLEEEARLRIKIDILEKIKEQIALEEQLQSIVSSNQAMDEKMEAEKKRAEMSPEERAIYDFEQQQKAKQEAFEAEKKRLEDEMKIYQFFQDQKFSSAAEVEKLIKDENLKNYSLQEQELILKLARERIQLEQQKEEKIKLEEDMHKKFNQLSNDTTNLHLVNLSKLKNEYKNLIAQIETALAKQAQLRGGRGFAIGGFTGSGANHEIAGVVHKNERVAPAWMTNQFADTFQQLEKIRLRGFAQGGFTTDNSRHIEQNNTINVQNVFDVEEFLDRQRRRLR